jgi:hypothetical protein
MIMDGMKEQSNVPPAATEPIAVQISIADVSDNLWKTYAVINEWIRFSDTKAAAILTADAAIVAAAVTGLAGSQPFFLKHRMFIVLLMLACLFCFFSFWTALSSIKPKLDWKSRPVDANANLWTRIASRFPFINVGHPNSLIFYAHIAKRFDSANDYEQAATVGFADETHSKGQIAQQVWANSKVCWRKFKLVSWATWWLALAVMVSLVGVFLSIPFVIYASPADSTNPQKEVIVQSAPTVPPAGGKAQQPASNKVPMTGK